MYLQNTFDLVTRWSKKLKKQQQKKQQQTIKNILTLRQW